MTFVPIAYTHDTLRAELITRFRDRIRLGKRAYLNNKLLELHE